MDEARSSAYAVLLKLHSKRSPHLSDGDRARDTLFMQLTSAEAVERTFSEFAADPQLGLIATKGSQRRLGEPGVMHNNGMNLAYLAKTLNFTFDEETPFAGGTMFWGRVDAYRSLASAAAKGWPFETEMGRIAGTLAHAFERAMGAIANAAGFKTCYIL